MVLLSLIRKSSYEPSPTPKWYQSRVVKINVAWGFLIFFGISTFVLARDITIGQRQEQMRARKAIQQQVKEELTSQKN